MLKGRFRRCRPENRLECCLRAVLPASPEPVQTLALTPACRRHCCLYHPFKKNDKKFPISSNWTTHAL